MNFGVNDRFDQGGDQVEVLESTSTPYNRSQWNSLHIGSARDKFPGTAVKANRNAHTLNDPAQSGIRPRFDYYSDGHNQNAEKGERQYANGHHEFSDQIPLLNTLRSQQQGAVFHSNDPELAAPSFGHSLLNTDGYKGHINEQVAPGLNTSIDQPSDNKFDPSVPTDMRDRPQLSNQFNRSKLDVEDLRSMYTLDQTIPNFLTLDRTAKQNFMASISDVRVQV
jgi:hypothetical protein